MNVTLPQNEIDALLKVFPQGVVALDVETTGISPLVDKLVELSAVKLTPNSIEVFDTLVNPGVVIPEHIIAIHNITNEMVANSPLVDEVLPKFFDFTAGLPLIAHNAKFDAGFLIYNLHQLKIKYPSNHVYCSCLLARKAIQETPNHKLSTLSTHFEIPLINHHRALDDAYAALRIYAKSLLSPHYNRELFNESSLCRMNDFGKNTELKIPQHLELLKDACFHQKTVVIVYDGGSHKGRERRVLAMSLLPMPSGNVLYAKCLIEDQYKNFSLKKIRKVRYE